MKGIGILFMTMLTAVGCSTAKPGRPTLELPFAESRATLAAAGLERRSHGGIVYWANRSDRSPAFVLLHGVNEHAGTWSAVALQLARRNRVIVPDLAGHGESAPAAGAISYAALIDSVRKVVEAEGLDRFVLVGNSMGGWIAMLYAFESPQRVERLVLENASGMAWPMTGAPLFPKTRDDAAKLLRAVHGPGVETPDSLLDELLSRRNTPLSRIDIADAVSHLVDARLAELAMPVNLIWGRHDGLLPLDYAQALQKKIDGAKLSVIEDAAHIPHRQQPGKFVKCLTASC